MIIKLKVGDRIRAKLYDMTGTVVKTRQRFATAPVEYGVVYDQRPDHVFWLGYADRGFTLLSNINDYVSPHYFQD